MIRVSNKKCVRRLGRQAMKAAKVRNFIAVAAIALTTVLFTSLFTIGMSINDGFQESNFRQAGGYNHGGFKYLTEEQFDELKGDPLMKEWGLRRFLGMPSEIPFNKNHVELGYSDANNARWMYCDPVEGRLPQEGTDEAATDREVLELLGVEPKVGNQFTMTFEVDGKPTTQTFTLCGWWEKDPVVVANHVILPESRVEAVLAEVGVIPGQAMDDMTGSYNLDVMLGSSLHIEEDLLQILANHGYQSESRSQAGYINIGVNWGYTGSQFAESLDPMMLLAIGAMLAIIIFTGYLIIYNVFQISVTNDIRFYGLLKTIGTTGRQIKTILRQQALLLSCIGIPIGLVAGWLVGGKLTPIVIARLDGVSNLVSLNPVIFVGAALFSLLTVFLSCAKPGRMAAKVSPIEAVRYTEGSGGKQKEKRSGKGISLVTMARANLGRSKGKTAVTVISLSLAVVLMTLTVTFTNSFDMDKYLRSVVSDFVAADASYFQTGNTFSQETSLPQPAVEEINAQGGVTEGGVVYGCTTPVKEFVTEDYFRSSRSWMEPEYIEAALAWMEKLPDGRVCDGVQLYGMEAFPRSKLKVLEGDLSKLDEPGGRYVAAVYAEDDYGGPRMDSHWARLGDTITLRHVEEFAYCNPTTGEVYGNREEDVPEGEAWRQRAVKYRDLDYEVAALVTVPTSLSYRYYGNDEFVMNDQTFLQDTGSNSVMLYAFDVEESKIADMEAFLADYTENQNPATDYESKDTYVAEFESFQSMFLLLGGALSFIVGLVGVLNFFNAILTGILTRRREFAVLQSIGMTGRQLKTMLVCEGLFYALGSVVFALAFILALSPLMASAVENLFWFLSYRFTLSPVLILAPIFAILGCVIPLAVYRVAAKASVVERLREADG